MNDTREPSPFDPMIGWHYRHKKTGGVYKVIMFATIEATMQSAVIYEPVGHDLGRRWVRPLSEFMDGRFEALSMSASQ